MKYILFDRMLEEMSIYWRTFYAQIPAYVFDEILRTEFAIDADPALTAYIFSTMNFGYVQLLKTQQRIAVMENELKSNRAQLALAQRRIAELETKLSRVN